AFGLPVLQPPPAGGRGSVHARQVAPAAAGAEDVENPIQRAPIVGARPARGGRPGEQRCDDGPLRVGQICGEMHNPSLERLYDKYTRSVAWASKGNPRSAGRRAGREEASAIAYAAQRSTAASKSIRSK